MFQRVTRSQKRRSFAIARFFTILFIMGVPTIGAAAPQQKDTVEVQIVSSQTRIHRNSSNAFKYTDVIIAQVDGMEVAYECDQRGNSCPLMESGKTYTASRAGDVIYISISSPDGEQSLAVRYKEVGARKGGSPKRSGRSLL
jgi:hypothetical protein